MDIKIIIFDLGGIVVPEVTEKIRKGICEFANVDENILLEHYNKLKSKLTKGELSLLDYYESLVEEMSLSVDADLLLKRHMYLYSEYGDRYNKDVLSLIETLKKKYMVVALTNTEIEVGEHNRGAGLFDYFDKVFLSTEMKVMKPEESIYLRVASDLQCSPKEVVFVDDRIENVEAAKRVCMNAILFENINQLKKELTKDSIVF